MMKRKYPISAQLNEEGMKQFGDVFPDGLVPILNPLSEETELEGVGEKQVHLVNLHLLKQSDEGKTYQKLLKTLSEKFNAPIKEIDEQFEEYGLPLRHELVSCVEIDPRFVI